MKGEIIMLYGKYAEVPCRPICFPLAPKPLPHGATIPTVYRSLHGKSLGRDGSGHKQETNTPSELHGRLQDQSNTEVSLSACITVKSRNPQKALRLVQRSQCGPPLIVIPTLHPLALLRSQIIY